MPSYRDTLTLNLPDPDKLEILAIPRDARRKLFQVLTEYPDFEEYRRMFGLSPATMTRDQYFQISHVLRFDVKAWLKKYHEARGTTLMNARLNVRASKSLAAVEMLHKMGYAWENGKWQKIEW